MNQLGQHIVDSVAESGAIERMIQEGDARIFVWATNANEQVEAAFLKRMEQEVARYLSDPDNITDFLGLLKVGAEKRDDPERIAAITIGSTLFQFLSGVGKPPSMQ